MNHILLILILSLFLPAFTAMSLAVEKEPPGAMVINGFWHGDEVFAKDGESWMALVEEGGEFALRDVEISVTIVADEVIDMPPAKADKQGGA